MSALSPRCAACILGAAVFLAVACSPVFNWREVPMEGDAELVALLPCKAERARRDLPLGNQSVTVVMAGCEAGGATFAVARASPADAAQAQSWLDAWRSQTQAQWRDGAIAESPARVAHAAPAPLRIEASRVDGQGTSQQVRLLWFAHLQRNGAFSLYQATVLGAPSAPDAAETFFEGLHLPRQGPAAAS
jgi:hypothetical protein